MKGACGRARLGGIAILGVTAFAIVGAIAFASAALTTPAASHPGAASPAIAPNAPSAPVASAPDKARVVNLLGKIPMRFERNDGQTDARVKFLSRGEGYTLFLTPAEAVLALRKPTKDPGSGIPRAAATRGNNRQKREPGSGISRSFLSSRAASASFLSSRAKSRDPGSVKVETQVLRVKLLGANSRAQIEGVDRLAAGSNYFIGNDPKKWHTDVPKYAKVELTGVYPGIDLIYHGGEQGRLEYDFRLAPGADPKSIRLSFRGERKLSLDRDGDLVVGIGESKLVEHAPEIYQEIGGMRRAVEGGWVIRGAHEAGFSVARYDRTKPIVIDPTLLYSTYLGGSELDESYGIAVDSSGNAYIMGDTQSTNFPILNAFQSTCPSASADNGCNAPFVAKLSPATPGLGNLTFKPGSLNFGDKTTVGKTSSAESVTIKNDSSKKSKIEVSITGEATAAGPFTVKKQCTKTLAPGKSCKVSVTFTPTETTEQTGELTINDDAGALHMVPLSGTGKAPKTKK